MTAKDKYNGIIKEIEERIESQLGERPGEIAERFAQQQGCSLRDLSATFTFLTGQPLIGYIRQRQMMAAYRCILGSHSYDSNEAISFTSCAEESAFIKSFKQCFHITPKQVFRDKNPELLHPAMTWAVISEEETNRGSTEEVKTVNADTLFGIEKDKVAKIAEALDCQAVYGFNQAQSEAAFQLAERIGAPMKDCFEFVDDYCIQGFMDEDGNSAEMDAAKMKEKILAAEFLARICLGFDLSVSQGMDILTEFASIGLDVGTISPDIVKLYLNGQLDIRRFWYAYNWGRDHDVYLDGMEDFLEAAAVDWPNLDLALSLTGEAFYEDCERMEMVDDGDHQPMTGHEVEFGETDFSQCERFDEEFDEENQGYDDGEETDDVE